MTTGPTIPGSTTSTATTGASTAGPAARLLLLAPRINETGLQLRTVAHRRGLQARTAPAYRVPEDLPATAAVHVYGGPLFADAVGQELGLALLDAAPDWLTTLPAALTGRRIECLPLVEARRLRRPAFLKPPVDKLFPARIHPDGSGLPGPDALDDDTLVLVSDIVAFAREYRLFVLDGAVHAASRYAVDGALSVAPLDADPHREQALAFAAEVLAGCAGSLPSAVVVDVGLLAGSGAWSVVEANPAWASGGYACDPDAVLDVVLRAAGPAADVRDGDRRFCRDLPQVVR
ncbi:ATP-grasp domain-containing protein [Kitasatospora sp. NBC_00240]|uniref:ATP-grasp domain-containing protein n=1 Tax=Kitasatospora sp. NBC_00240 TaxID=2903567 RepID=UPI002255D5F4|nr:ATP-grasp domain-containing protein [Kitasatospora sp. NBC_00240]MCX5213983.1 ATP-grasp domain-containing protein [Kitasatospora sp. NBC_00240]